MRCPIKPPKVPRILCNSYFHYLLGIPSPSKLVHYACTPKLSTEADAYFAMEAEYKFYKLQWLIDKRIATKKDFKNYTRMLKDRRKAHPTAEMTLMEAMKFGMQQISKKAKDAFEQIKEGVWGDG